MTKTSARKAVAEKAHSTYRKTATKAVAEKARGTYRKTAAQFEEVQPGDAMEGYVHSIEKAALKNEDVPHSLVYGQELSARRDESQAR